MSKKKKKNNPAANQEPQKPEAAKTSGENSENYIMIEIPDKSEGKSPETEQEENTSKPEEKTEDKAAENPEKSAPPNTPTSDKSKWDKLRKLKNIAASLKKKAAAQDTDSPKKAAPPQNADSSENAALPPQADSSDASGNPQNEISIELPDSEAEKIKTFVPQVTSPEKPPLTPEQIAAKKHHNRIVLTKTANVVLLVILVIMGLLMILPIFFAIMQTVKTTAELGDVPHRFFPKDFTFKSFVSLFTSTGEVGVPFYRFIFNTVFVAAVVTFLRILVTVPAAYVLAKVKAPMIKTLNRIVEWSLALTPALAFTLNNAFMSKTWFADTYFAVILPFITSPLCLVLIRGAIRSIPDDSVAAARLEGCSHIMILRKLVIPQIRPIIAAVAVLSLFEIGKISGGPLTFGETMDMLPAFMEQLGERGAAGEMYVLALLMFVPVVVLTVIFRKSILKAMTTATLKDEV